MQTLDKPEVEVSPRPRSPAMLIVLAALLILAAGALGWWIGSSGDDGAVGDVPAIVELLNQAWVDGDADAVAVLYAADATYENIDVSSGGRKIVVSGRSSIRDNVSAAMVADFEAMTADYITILEDVIIYQWTANGTVGTASITPFESTGMTILEIDDGLVAKGVLYYDSAEIYGASSSS